MQQQSSQESFERAATRIRSNLSFCGPTNIQIKEDVELYRRKLNASYSSGFLRQTEAFSQPNCELIENHQNWTNVPRSVKTNAIFFSKAQPATSIQPRIVHSPVPEETDLIVNRLSSELSESNKEIHYLKKIISKNEEAARITITSLQSQIRTLRTDNQQLRISQERSLGQLNNLQRGQEKSVDCQRCHTLEERIRQLENQLREIGRKYEMQRQRNVTTLTANSHILAPNVVQNLKLVEERLTKTTIQMQQLQSQNLQLKKKISQLHQKDFNNGEEYNLLVQELNKITAHKSRFETEFQVLNRRYQESTQKISQLNYFMTRVRDMNAKLDSNWKASDSIGQSQNWQRIIFQLETRIGDIHSKLGEKTIQISQLQTKQIDNNLYLKSLQESNSQLEQNIIHFQSIQTRYKQRIFELQQDIQRTKFNQTPINIDKDQLLIQNQQVVQELRREREKNQGLRQELTNRQTLHSELSNRLEEADYYIKNVVTANMQQQSKQIESLVNQNAVLKLQLKGFNKSSIDIKRIEELQILLQDQQFKYTTLQQQKNDLYSQLLTVKNQNSELSHELSVTRVKNIQLEGERQQISHNLNLARKQIDELMQKQKNFTTEINRITTINEQQARQYIEISSLSVNSKIEQSSLLEEVKVEQQRLFNQQLQNTVQYYESKLNNISSEVKKQIEGIYMLKQGEFQRSIDILRQQVRKDQEAQLQLVNRNKQLQIRLQTVIDQSPPSPQKNQYVLQIANQQLTNEINTLRLNNEELYNRLSQAEDYILQVTGQLEQLIDKEQFLNQNISSLQQEKNQSTLQLKKLNEEINYIKSDNSQLKNEIIQIRQTYEKTNDRLRQLQNTSKDKEIAYVQQIKDRDLKEKTLIMSVEVKEKQLKLLLEENEHSKNAKSNTERQLQIKQKEYTEVCNKITQLTKSLLLKDQKIADILSRPKSPVKQKFQDQSVAQLTQQSEEKTIFIGQLTQKLTKIEEQYIVKQQQKETLQNWFKELEATHKTVYEEAEFFKAKLIEAEDYIGVLTRQREELIKQIQQLRSVKTEGKVPVAIDQNSFKQQITQFQQQIIIFKQQKETNDHQLIEKDNLIQETRNEADFLKNKLEEADNFIMRLQDQLESKNQILIKHQQMSISSLQPLKLQNNNFRNQILILQQQITKLSDQKSIISSNHQEFELSIIKLQQQVKISSLKMANEDQRMQSLIKQKDSWILKLRDNDNYIKSLQEDNRQLKEKLAETEQKASAPLAPITDEEYQNIRIKIIQLQRIINEVTSEANFFKSRLVQAEEYISQLEKSKEIVVDREVPQTNSSIDILHENQALKRHLQMAENQISRLALQGSQKDTDMTQMQSVIEEIALKLEDSQKELQKVTKDALILREKLIQSESSVTQLESLRVQHKKILSIVALQQTITQQNESLRLKLSQIFNDLARLEKEKKDASQKIKQNQSLVIGLQQNIATFTKQVKDSQSKVKLLENDKINAEVKIKETKNSVQIIQVSLDEFKTKAKESEGKIIKLEEENREAVQKAEEAHRILEEISKQEEFLRNKLIEAQGYIAYLESLNTNEAHVIPVDQVNQIQNLRIELGRLLQENRVLETEKTEAGTKLQKNLETVKTLQQSLDSQKAKLKQAADYIVALESQRQAAELKLVEFQRLVQESNNQAAFYKEKLREAEEYIVYLENEKTTESPTKVKTLPQDNEKIELANRVVELQEQKRLLQELRQSSANESSKREIFLKNLQQNTSQLNQKVRDFEGRITRLNEEKKNYQEKIKSMDTLETKLRESSSEIISLKKLIQTLQQGSSHLSQRMRDAEGRANRLMEEKTIAEEKIKNTDVLQTKLKEANSDIIYLKRLVQNLQQSTSQLELNIRETEARENRLSEEKKIAQEKIKSIHTYETKLIEADSEIMSLRRQVQSLTQAQTAYILIQNQNGAKQTLLQQRIKSLEIRVQNDVPTDQEQNKSLLIQVRNKDDLILSLQSSQRVIETKLSILETQISKHEEEIEFFKTKLFDAQNYITQMQAINSKLKEDIIKSGQDHNLQEKIKVLEYQIKNIQKEKKILEDKVTPTEKKVETLIAQADFFKKKLLEAEQYIVHLEQIREMSEQHIQITVNQGHNQNNAQNSTDFVNKIINELKDTKKKLQLYQINADIRDQNNQEIIKDLEDQLKVFASKDGKVAANVIPKDSKVKDSNTNSNTEQAEFFKQKLMEAESYISELQKQNTDSANTVQILEEKVRALINDVANINDKLMKSDAQKCTLLGENKDFADKAQKLKAQIQSLKELPPYDPEKVQLKSSILSLQRDLENEKLKTSQIKKVTQQEGQSVEFLKSKLHEAEAYICELQAQNQTFNDAITSLNSQVNPLKKELEHAHVKLTLTSQEKQSCIAQIQGIKSQYEHLKSLKSNKSVSEEILPLKERIESLQAQLQTEKNQHLDEVEQLTNHIEQLKQYQLSQNAAIDEVLSSNRIKMSKVQDENTHLKEEVYLLNEDITHLREDLINAQADKVQLRRQNQSIANTNIVLSETALKNSGKPEQVENLKKQLEIELAIYRKDVEELRNKVRQRESEVAELHKEKRNAGERFRDSIALVEKLQIDMNDLHQQMNEKDDKINELQIQNQRMEKIHQQQMEDLDDEESPQFFKDKLLEAESYISELEHQNENFSNGIQTLQEQIKVLNEEIDSLNERLVNIEEDKIELVKKVKGLQKQLIERQPTEKEGDEKVGAEWQKDFKNQEIMLRNNIEALTTSLSNREVVMKSLEADKLKLQKKVQEGQNSTKNLSKQLVNQRSATNLLKEAKDKLEIQSKALADNNLLLLREKQVYEMQIAQLSEQTDELKSLLQSREREIEVLFEKNEKSRSNNKPTHQQILDQGQLQDSIQEDADLCKELTRQIESLTVQLEKKDEENRQLKVENFNLEEEIRELQTKLQSSEELQNNLVDTERLNLELQNDKHRLQEQLEALEKEKAYLSYQINRLTNSHREAEGKLYQQDSKIQELQKQLTDVQRDQSEPQQLMQDILRGSVRKLIDLTNNYSEQYNSPEKTIIEELQPFPYLQQLVNSIFYRLKIAEQRQLSKNLEIKALTEELEAHQSLTKLHQGRTSSPPRLERDRVDLEQLRQSMESDHEQKINEMEVEMDNLRWSQKELKNKIQDNESEREELVNQLRQAQRRIDELTRAQDQHRREEEELALQNQLLSSNLNQAEHRIAGLEQSQTSYIKEQQLGETIRKIIDLTNNYNQEIDQPQAFPELDSFPYLSELINSILYRLKLSSAIDVQKSLKIDKLSQESEQLKWKIDELIRENDLLRQNNSQVLGQLVEREANNQELSDKLNEISDEVEKQNDQIQVLERELANKRPSLNSDTPNAVKDMLHLEFLNQCLYQIKTMEDDVQEVEREIERVANAELANRTSRSEDTNIIDQLKELEERVKKNAVTIRKHQEKEDKELITLLTDLKDNKALPQVDKNKIEEYLSQLENQIIREHEQHLNQISRINEQLTSNWTEGQQGKVTSIVEEDTHDVASREDLLKEINSLNNAIEIYHQETMRRKRQYKRTVEGLLKDLCELKFKYDEINQQREDDGVSYLINDLGLKMKLVLDNEENEDLNHSGLEGEGDTQYMISGHYSQFIGGDKEKKERLSGLSGFSREDRNLQHREIQTDDDSKPFLNYVLNNRDLDKEDILMLKKKISDMKSKEVDYNMRFLRVQEKKLEEMIIQTNGESTPHQIDNIMLTLAHNHSPEQISQIFASDDNDDILKKINDALYLEDSFFKGQSSSILLRQIEECMLRYYEKPTKLSEDVYGHLISILVAKNEEELYTQVEALFRDLYEIQTDFDAALRKKDEVYRLHNERMNKIFNRSSSDVSEDYLSGFDGQVEQNEIHMSSATKYRGSDLDSYNFIGREKEKE